MQRGHDRRRGGTGSSRLLAVGLACATLGCVPSQTIRYSLDGLPRAPHRSEAVLAVALLEDARQSVLENRLVFTSDRQVVVGGRTYCANSERRYDPREPVARGVTLAIRDHLARRGGFREVVLAPDPADLVLTGTVRQLYGVQERSQTAAVAAGAGALFGVIGAIAGAAIGGGATSSGIVRIELTDLVLQRADGTVVQRLDPVLRAWEGVLPADGACARIFDHVNAGLRDAVEKLAAVVEARVASR